ncbi:hypothetical protein DY000_02035005 [Brassica cretica]|uniref:Uncharacterized protein n=1 Tax=Brassica cretica TaxID=69181 RepID=A0ABQ7DF37_BRACR|nr:hypothetical protein DY000_02035005 [Brassica cretica]
MDPTEPDPGTLNFSDIRIRLRPTWEVVCLSHQEAKQLTTLAVSKENLRDN